MGRIRGWKKTYGINGRLIYLSKEYGLEIFSSLGDWIVRWWRIEYGEVTKEFPHKRFRTKSQAMRYAINWMRRHPRG